MPLQNSLAAVNAGSKMDLVDAPNATAVTALNLALANKLGTPVNTGGTATLAALIGDLANESMLARFEELEGHVHNWERWLCAAAVPNAGIHVADRIGATATSTSPFTLTSGNDTWGNWVQLLGSSDTPVVAGMVRYDLHRILVLVANTVSPYFIQIGFGTSGAQALTDNTFSSLVINPASNTDKTEALPFMSKQQAAGTKAWGRCWCVGSNAKTLTVMFGLHEYAG